MSDHTVSFESNQIGATPEGWIATLTGKGDSKWTVESDETGPSKFKVLKQSGRATYPLLLKNDTNIKDGFIEVKFKAIAGSLDRAAGVVWRAEMRTITTWSGPTRWRTISFFTKPSTASAVRLTSLAGREATGLLFRCRPTPGIVYGLSSKLPASARPSTANNCLRSKIPRSPMPEW